MGPMPPLKIFFVNTKKKKPLLLKWEGKKKKMVEQVKCVRKMPNRYRKWYVINMLHIWNKICNMKIWNH